MPIATMPGPPVMPEPQCADGPSSAGWLQSRFRHGDHQIADAAAAENNLSIRLMSFSETFLPRMRAEVDAVARRQHADAVVDDGFRRVGARRDRPITPNGEYSNSTMPPSPVSAVVVRSSTPGVLSSAALFSKFIFFVAHPRFIGALFRQGSPDAASAPDVLR